MPSIHIVDTETFGLDAMRHPAWEIAVITLDVGSLEVRERQLWQVQHNNFTVERADPKALEINRYSERFDPKHATSPGTFCREFAYIWKQGDHWMGANPRFDVAVLSEMMSCHGVKTDQWSHHLLDIEAMMLGARLASDVNPSAFLRAFVPYKSGDLTQAFIDGSDCDGIPDRTASKHTAMGDCEWVLDCFNVFLGGLIFDPEK